MKQMPDSSIDLILTDPPYGVNYEGGQFHSGNVKIKRKREKLINDDIIIYDKLWGELYRLLKDKYSGGAYVFYGSSLTDKIFPVKPFEKYQVLIWGKSNATYGAIGARYKFNHESYLWLQKPPSNWNGDSKQASLRWLPCDSINNYHPTQKPLNLMLDIIINSSDDGGIVFDPFLGSGTTAVAAKQLGRKFIGCEISEKYCKIAKDRLKQEELF